MKYNIDGKYSMMANWLLVNKLGDGMYSVKNLLTDEIYELDSQTYHFLRNLNGNRNPYKVACKLGVDAEKLMDFFDVNFLIRTEGRTLLVSSGTILHTVFIPMKKKTKSIIPKLYNLGLGVGFLPMLLYGFYRILFTSYRFNADYMLLGYVFAIAIGLTMHELSHAMACLCYGGNFFEAGVTWQKFYPGAYVLIDKSGIDSKLKRVQVDAAGVEMNLMLTGIFLVLSTVIEVLSGFFLYAAMINGILAVFNLAFIDGLDGSSVVGELLGLPDGVDGAKNLLKEASWEVVNALKEKGYGSVLESQLPVADFKVIIQPIKGFSEYIRGTHMDTGEVGCEWRDGESLRTSYLFVSRKRDVIVKRITSTSPDLEMTFGMDIHYNTTRDSAEKYAKHVLETKECSVRDSFINYTALNDDGTLYGTVAQICPADGIWEENHGKIKLSQCSEVLIFIKPFIKACKEQKNTVLAKLQEELSEITADYDSLLKEHARLHKKWYNSADFSLNYRGKYHSNEQLLAEAYSGKQPPELIEKLWKYGRYLFISGTSDKDNPFPLYGLWAGDYRLMWSHNMANENTEMIYWHSYVGNLLPFQKGLYKYYNNRIPEYRDNAKKLFGMNGIYMTAGTTPGVCKPTQVVPVIINWVGAAGWIAEHYCNYYWYTRDEKYLQKVILPYLEEVAAFYEDFIEFYPDGSIHFYPSVSPENTPGNFMPPPEKQMAHPMPTTVNSTIDLAIVKEFFTNMCRLAEEKNLYQDRVAAWKKILDSIPDYQESKDGGIKEWMDSRFDERYDHRHLSHIYPVFPSVEVNSLHKKDLLPLFKRSVELRKIDAQTGWSMAHMASIYARLEDGRNAIECLNNMAKTSLTNNFFSLHNDWRGMNVSLCMDPAPVQLDAVVGYVNAIQEMLVYSSEELVKLLPALSDELKKGSVKDFRYVNGMLNMQWDVQKNSFCAVLKAERAHKLWIQLPKEFTGYQFETTDCSIKRDGELFCLEMGKQATIKITV